MTSKETIIAAFIALECEPGSSEEDIKSSYRQLVRVWHPDRFETDPKLKLKATEKMKLINEAYQLLLRCFKEHKAFTESTHTKSEPTNSAKSNNGANQEAINRGEFEVGSERFNVRRYGPTKNGDFGFIQEVIMVQDFSGRVIYQRDRTFITKPFKTEGNFENASRQSMAFILRPEQGVKTPVHDPTEGIPHPRYRDRYLYSFADGSSVEIGNSTVDIFRNFKLDWRSPRFKLAEIVEDYQFFKGQQNWKQCVLFAHKALVLHPQTSWGWIHRSYALHCLKMTKDALWALQNQALEKFKNETTIYYNLACYSAQLGQKQEAKNWLKSAFKLAAKERQFERYRDMAMRDSDLTPIQGSIPQIALLSKIARFF